MVSELRSNSAESFTKLVLILVVVEYGLGEANAEIYANGGEGS